VRGAQHLVSVVRVRIAAGADAGASTREGDQWLSRKTWTTQGWHWDPGPFFTSTVQAAYEEAKAKAELEKQAKAAAAAAAAEEAERVRQMDEQSAKRSVQVEPAGDSGMEQAAPSARDLSQGGQLRLQLHQLQHGYLVSRSTALESPTPDVWAEDPPVVEAARAIRMLEDLDCAHKLDEREERLWAKAHPPGGCLDGQPDPAVIRAEARAKKQARHARQQEIDEQVLERERLALEEVRLAQGVTHQDAERHRRDFSIAVAHYLNMHEESLAEVSRRWFGKGEEEVASAAWADRVEAVFGRTIPDNSGHTPVTGASESVTKEAGRSR
jgi:hypothetical protein